MPIFDLTSEGANRLLGFSNIMLVIGLIIALLATVGTIWASAVIGEYSNIRQAETEVAVANASAASKASDARAAEATLRAAEANERAAKLENETADLKNQAEEAKTEAARVNERIKKMQSIRRLSKDSVEALTWLFKSHFFQKDPKPTLRVSSVGDAEANIYAMDFLNLLRSCSVEIYPTPGGTNPGECIQVQPSTTGLVLSVKTIEASEATIPFAKFQYAMDYLGLAMSIDVDPRLRENEAVLYVLRKPSEE